MPSTTSPDDNVNTRDDAPSDEEVTYEPYLFPAHDVQTWGDYHSSDLSSLWLSCKEFLDAQGLPILDNCKFTDFVAFCHRFSSGRVALDDLQS